MRRGRISTADKLALAVRTEQVFPAGVFPEAVAASDCKLSHKRSVWRLENGQAVLVAYEVYRGPRNRFGKIPGVIGRSEFGLAGRDRKVAALDDNIFELCGPAWLAELPPTAGPANDYRLLCNELMRLMIARQLFTFVTAAPIATPRGETTPVAGTNNESERTLRGPAMARKTGRTSKTIRGARRQTIVVSVLESLRQQLSQFTLANVIREVLQWSGTGQSCFAQLLTKLRLRTPAKSILDRLLPVPSG